MRRSTDDTSAPLSAEEAIRRVRAIAQDLLMLIGEVQHKVVELDLAVTAAKCPTKEP